MTSMGSRKGAAPAGMVLMLVAFVVMAGFMYWLAVTAEPSNIQIEPTDEEAEAAAPELLRITTDSFAIDPAVFVGQHVRLINLQSTNLLSGQVFTVGIDSIDYVVQMGEGPTSEGIVIFPGDMLHLNGQVQRMDQAMADSLAASGAIGDGQQEAVMINPTFIVASDIEILDPESGQ